MDIKSLSSLGKPGLQPCGDVQFPIAKIELFVGDGKHEENRVFALLGCG